MAVLRYYSNEKTRSEGWWEGQDQLVVCTALNTHCVVLVWFGLPGGKIAEGRSGGESGRGLWEVVQWGVTDH